MTTQAHHTGTVDSGDVTLFYRVFGTAGRPPILIFHGANYYDSADWIEVGTALAKGRQVIAWDTRGFGESTRSPSKNYSYEAHASDVTAILDHLGIDKAVMMGHSMGGGHSIIYAARFPERTAALVVVDHCPGRGGRIPKPEDQSVGNPDKVYESPEAALAAMSRVKDMPKGSPAWKRVETMLKRAEGGYVFNRDPDFSNHRPLGVPADWRPKILVEDMWAELARVQCPTMIVRGTLSDRYDAPSLNRVRTEFPEIALVEIESGHDVAGWAPGALVDAVASFLAERVDGAAAQAR